MFLENICQFFLLLSATYSRNYFVISIRIMYYEITDKNALNPSNIICLVPSA